MVDSDIPERPGQAERRSGPVFDLIAAKLRRPRPRPGTVRRSSLIEKLARGNSGPLVSVVAPAGYGKTTLLAQWAERNGQAFAWVQVDEHDNDPKILLRYVAGALDAIEPVGERVFEALASPVSSVPGSVVPRLGSAFASMTVPVVLVLDDVHLLHNRECRAALSVLADHVPAGGRLVLAGRDTPPVRVARLRAEGRITEIGAADLALTRAEATVLLRAAEVALGEEDLADLHQRTEGWAAGLYLAALSLREGGSLPHTAVSFDGADRFISEYVESELLARISRDQREFLTRTAVLDRMSGPLCEAALDLPGSAATLAELARSNLLLVPLDRRGEWYRYHHLFRDMLHAELERSEPGLVPVVRRRAAAWCERSGLPEEALEYSIAAGDVDTAARLVEQIWLQVHFSGRRATTERWLAWLEERGGIKGHPVIAVMASVLYLTTGRPVESERWADMVDRWQYHDADWPGDAASEGWAAMIRCTRCRDGIEQLRADAKECAWNLAAAGHVNPAPDFYLGLACVFSGDPQSGDPFFQDAVTVAEPMNAQEVLVSALCERSLLAMARGEWHQAETLADRARRAARLPGLEQAVVWMVHARIAMHRGDIPAARQALANAQRMRHLLSFGIPHLSAQTLIGLAQVHLALADVPGARTIMREIDEILRRRPDLGALVGEAAELRAQLASERGTSTPGASSLTGAELRMLPLLATHLSYPEIAAELFVSTNTIKSQAYSLFRKLGASSRSQAVARARELALLEG
jgi:LuxR family transcriptional regulator, maltose regulon positive regulatory protein